ncbi:MAG: DUF5056 domain-containing protein [Chthoniobacterales bacterium]
MDEQLQEDWLDARLRDEASYIDDDGFTARVMKQLPARGQSRSSRSVILIGVTVVACLLAYLLSGRGAFLGNAAAFLVAVPFNTLVALAIVSGLVITVLGASAAVVKVRDPRL